MKRFILSILTILAASCFISLMIEGLSYTVSAQEKEEKSGVKLGLEDSPKFIGSVKEVDVKKNSLTVKKADEETEILFAVDKKTKYKDVKGLKNIKVGDKVIIQYGVVLGSFGSNFTGSFVHYAEIIELTGKK